VAFAVVIDRTVLGVPARHLLGMVGIEDDVTHKTQGPHRVIVRRRLSVNASQ
jgi:hypothetical protein